MASYYPEEGRSSSEGGDSRPRLPFRSGGVNRAAHTEARAELRDRETYYAELRLAVHGQSRFFPGPRAALEDSGADTWPRRADGNTQAEANGGSSTDAKSSADGKFSTDTKSSVDEKPSADEKSSADEKFSADGKSGADGIIRSDGESWDDMTARLDDTWT